MFERFSSEARSTVTRAYDVRQRRGDRQIGCEHLLIGLASAGEPHLLSEGLTESSLEQALAAGPGSPESDAQALRAIGIDIERIRDNVDKVFGPEAWTDAEPALKRSGGITERILGRSARLTPAAKKALELALREAIVDHSREISTTHLLRAILRSPGTVVPAIVPDATLARLRESTRRAA
ncbi:MAG: Clp protease [Actinomycetales bacterium]|nr:Clp protease [Actinomycetales bacterium]